MKPPVAEDYQSPAEFLQAWKCFSKGKPVPSPTAGTQEIDHDMRCARSDPYEICKRYTETVLAPFNQELKKLSDRGDVTIGLAPRDAAISAPYRLSVNRHSFRLFNEFHGRAINFININAPFFSIRFYLQKLVPTIREYHSRMGLSQYAVLLKRRKLHLEADLPIGVYYSSPHSPGIHVEATSPQDLLIGGRRELRICDPHVVFYRHRSTLAPSLRGLVSQDSPLWDLAPIGYESKNFFDMPPAGPSYEWLRSKLVRCHDAYRNYLAYGADASDESRPNYLALVIAKSLIDSVCPPEWWVDYCGSTLSKYCRDI